MEIVTVIHFVLDVFLYFSTSSNKRRLEGQSDNMAAVTNRTFGVSKERLK